MQKMFEQWVLGTLEDDPLPYEVRHIIFCLHKEGFLSFGGQEILPKMLFNFEYYPLEAQFFPLKTPQRFSLYSLRKLLENALHSDAFAHAFQEKQIFFCAFESHKIFKIES